MKRALLALWLSACAHLPAPSLPAFEGPGRLLLLIERDGARELALLGEGGPRVLDARALGGVASQVRFLDRDSLLLLLEVASGDEFGLPDHQLRVLALGQRRSHPVGERGRRYDPEPSPDARYLAVGAELPGLGDSDFEIWSLAGEPERIALRHQSLEEPRWSPDGLALVASLLMADPETDEDTGGGFAGTALTWPRMHRLRRDLGDPELIWDGERPETLAPGGSLALWWDARGIWARQNRGLVRCELAARRCALVFAAPEGRRIVDGRAAGADVAWLLGVEARDAFDRQLPDEALRVSLATGELLARWRAPPGTAILDVDWTE
jgi:hypothetical protein